MSFTAPRLRSAALVLAACIAGCKDEHVRCSADCHAANACSPCPQACTEPTETESLSSGLCESGDWCWLSPRPVGHDILTVAQASDGTVWLGGVDETLLRQTSAGWERVDLPTGVLQMSSLRFDQAGTLWATIDGQLYQRSGQSWSQVTLPSGFSGSKVYVAPASGQIWVLGNGVVRGATGADLATADVELADTTPDAVTEISVDDAWVAGSDGSLRHWHGGSWDIHDLAALFFGVELHDLWQASAGHVWVAGLTIDSATAIATSGLVWRWNGTTFEDMHVPTKGVLAIGGRDEQDLWVADLDSYAHWDGSAWSTLSAPKSNFTNDALDAADGKTWFVGNGGGIAVAENGAVRDVAERVNALISDLWQTPDGSVWAVDDQDALVHFDAAGWARYPIDDLGDDYPVALTGTGDDVWAITAYGLLVHWDGCTMNVTSPQNPTLRGWNTIWSTDDGALWIGGDSFLARRSASGEWTQYSQPLGTKPPFNDDVRVLSIWGRAANDIWIAGERGRTTHWNGSSFDTRPNLPQTPEIDRILGVGDNVWAFSDGGIYEWIGLAWEQLSGSLGSAHVCDASATGNEVWADSDRGLLHWNGSAWENLGALPILCAPGYTSVWSNGQRVWVAAGNSILAH